MFNKILVVCVGNVCRSPTAERLLKRFHPSLTVASAGLGALVGKGADPAAASVASAHDFVFGKSLRKANFRASVPGI